MNYYQILVLLVYLRLREEVATPENWILVILELS